MDLDPLTADHPDRTAREDEEAAAEACERELGRAPVLLWTPASKAAMQAGVLRPRVLVVATTPEACALLRPAAEVGTLAGSIVLPGTSLAGLCLPAGGPSDAACCVHWASDETNQPTLIALAHAPPSPERSPAIADALLTVVDADAVVVVGSVPAHVVPGGGEGDTVFALPSSTAAPPAATTPLLPPGVALTGLTAALFSRLQASGRHAVALASVDACAGAPGAAALAALAAALSDALAGAGAPAAVIEALGKPVAAAVALDGADAVTSRSAVYV